MCCDWVEQARGNMFEVEWYLWAAGGSGEEARGMVIGIGLHGMTVKLPAAYGRGSMVDFEVWLAPSHSIRVVGEVVCREYSRHNFCLHVEFRVMREEDRTSLESTLRQMRRELPPNPTGGSANPFICPNWPELTLRGPPGLDHHRHENDIKDSVNRAIVGINAA